MSTRRSARTAGVSLPQPLDDPSVPGTILAYGTPDERKAAFYKAWGAVMEVDFEGLSGLPEAEKRMALEWFDSLLVRNPGLRRTHTDPC